MENKNIDIEVMKKNAIKNKYDFMIVFDVKNGNPNGDPDNDNMPRVDPETGLGQVSSVCLKRKIRNYIELVKEDEQGYAIYVKNDCALETKDKASLEYIGVKPNDKTNKKNNEKNDMAKWFMAANYFDIRAFGAVMTSLTKVNFHGALTGPVQINMGNSVDPIYIQQMTITRQAITKESQAEEKVTEMGRKYFIPYGLYTTTGTVNCNLAEKTTGFSDDDLELLWKAITNMFENEHSDARGMMSVRKLIIFKHDSRLGNYPSTKLFDKINISRKKDCIVARDYKDYNIIIDENMPEGVTLIVKD